MEESLREKLLNHPDVLDVPEDATLDELLALQKKYFPSDNAKPSTKPAKKQMVKKSASLDDENSDSDDADTAQKPANAPAATQSQKTKDKPKERDNPFQKARISQKEAWTSEQIAEVVDRVLNSVPGHNCKYPLFMQRFREFSGHGWTKQHQQFYGSLKDWVAGSDRFAVVAGDVICRKDAVAEVAARAAAAAPVPVTTTAKSESSVAKLRNRAQNPNVVGVDGMFDDDDDENDKDRGCAPSATKWGLQAPLLIILFFLLTAALFGYALEQQWVPAEVVEAVPAFGRYHALVKRAVAAWDL